MTKEEIYQYLTDLGIEFEVLEHQPVYQMTEQVSLPHPESLAKTLFLRDDKKEHYYLVSVRGDKRLDLKALRQEQGTRKLTFASADDLAELLQLQPGFVSPLGILNAANEPIAFFLDQDFQDADLIGIHPNDNTATLFLQIQDLLDLLTQRGYEVRKVAL